MSLKFLQTRISMATKKAYLAGGCFWGMQELFRRQSGVIDTEAGDTRDSETLEITYDSEKTSFKKLLDFFFRIHDPTTLNQQGNDRGKSYRSAIFYQNDEEKKEAEAFIELVNKSGRWDDPVVTTLEAFDDFDTAEEFHQDFLQKNPGGYTCHYVRFGSYL